MEPGRAEVRETEPRFRRESEQGSGGAGEQQQTELLTLHLLPPSEMQTCFFGEISSSPHHITQEIHAITYG